MSIPGRPPAVLHDVLMFLEDASRALGRAEDGFVKQWGDQAGRYAAVLRGVLEKTPAGDTLPVTPALRPDAPLSARETQVLALIARGHSNKDIGRLLGISVKTVEAHKANAIHRLGLYTRADLVRHAFVVGWLP